MISPALHHGLWLLHNFRTPQHDSCICFIFQPNAGSIPLAIGLLLVGICMIILLGISCYCCCRWRAGKKGMRGGKRGGQRDISESKLKDSIATGSSSGMFQHQTQSSDYSMQLRDLDTPMSPQTTLRYSSSGHRMVSPQMEETQVYYPSEMTYGSSSSPPPVINCSVHGPQPIYSPPDQEMESPSQSAQVISSNHHNAMMRRKKCPSPRATSSSSLYHHHSTSDIWMVNAHEFDSLPTRKIMFLLTSLSLTIHRVEIRRVNAQCYYYLHHYDNLYDIRMMIITSVVMGHVLSSCSSH